MELNEIKKLLYKENPTAFLNKVNKSGITYRTYDDEDKNFFFLIPFSDIGDATFDEEMDSKLLIRWIVQN